MECIYCYGEGKITHKHLFDEETGDYVVETCWYCNGSGIADY